MSNSSTPAVTLTGRFADRGDWTADGCPIDATVSLVGARSMMLLLREAFYGAHCFKDFVARAGFTEAVTAARLKELVRADILELRPYQAPGQRRRDAYYLTQKGLDLFPVLVALAAWGQRWEGRSGGAPVLTHGGACGARLEAEVRCSAGHPVDVTQAALAEPRTAPTDTASQH